MEKMRKVKILVTGLCLSRNRGGPAMAISFMNQIARYLPAEFSFAVDPEYMDLERRWAARYNVVVVPRDTILHVLRHSHLFGPLLRLWQYLRGKASQMEEEKRADWRSSHREYVAAFKRADCVISLDGIAFVGEGARCWVNALSQSTDSIYARKLKRPFLRFIQSYGPFRDWRVKLLAKLEFKNLPFVMARGRLSAGYCKGISAKTPVYSFPDVAITLPCAEDRWLYGYLERFNLKGKDYVVLSPSAVIYSMQDRANSSLGYKHVVLYAKIAEYYARIKKKLLFLPHATSSDPSRCDRIVCKNVIAILKERLIEDKLLFIVDDELDCRELKALIKSSQLAIVSRYHALVAALSTGVPTVSIGWNDKYLDLMEFYKSGEFAVDARVGEPEILCDEVLGKTKGWTNQRIELLKDFQAELEDLVNRAGKMCAEWILDVTKHRRKKRV